SITQIRWAFAFAIKAFIGTIFPYKCTGITALVLAETASSQLSLNKPSSSVSQKTGFAPTITTASAVETQVIAGTITSSPGPTSKARNASSSASVPLAQEMENCE